jgi:tetratricopeptide (TPR) repeat protein
VLRATYSADGIVATIDKYHELRDRYFGAGAYDFRPAVLVRLANGLAQQGAWDDSLALATMNEEAHPAEPFAARARMTIQVARQFEEHGVAAALAYFDGERGKEAAGVVDDSILDGLGWRIYRQERIDEALHVFRRNLQLFPAEYIPNESLGDALWFAGNKADGIAIFETWVKRNPGNDMGRRRLLNMREDI